MGSAPDSNNISNYSKFPIMQAIYIGLYKPGSVLWSRSILGYLSKNYVIDRVPT